MHEMCMCMKTAAKRKLVNIMRNIQFQRNAHGHFLLDTLPELATKNIIQCFHRSSMKLISFTMLSLINMLFFF